MIGVKPAYRADSPALRDPNFQKCANVKCTMPVEGEGVFFCGEACTFIQLTRWGWEKVK